MSDSDSYLSYPSDEEDMPCCPFDLDPMSSESSDESPDNVSIKVLKGQADAHFENPDTSYLEKLQSRQRGACVFFPLKLTNYLSENHPCIIDGLKGLGYDESFVYIGRSLVVSLNVDNDRIKVPKQLICDTIIFAHNRPVTVLSFVRTNDKPEKYALYNSLLSRHITKIMRTSLQENISVISGVVEEQGEIKKRIEEFEDRASLFSIAGSHKMNASRSRAAAKSILQTAAECKVASLIDTGPEKEGTERTLSEQMIDLNDVCYQPSITFQNNRVALESTVLRKHYPKLDIGPRMQGYSTVIGSSLPVAGDKDSLNSERSVSVADHNTELVYTRVDGEGCAFISERKFCHQLSKRKGASVSDSESIIFENQEMSPCNTNAPNPRKAKGSSVNVGQSEPKIDACFNCDMSSSPSSYPVSTEIYH